MIDVLFMGRKRVAAQCLEILLARSDVRVIGVLTDSHLQVSPTADLARQEGLRLYDFDEALAKINVGSLRYDLGLSMLYWRRLKEGFLTVPVLGTINFHPAPLPELKGTAGYNIAVLEARETWAVSAHYVDEGIDTGGIIDMKEFGIDPENETAQSVERRTQPVLEDLFCNVVTRAIMVGHRLPCKANAGGRYISRVEMERMKEIRPGDDIERKIRAFWFPPYDGAYIVIEGMKYTLVSRALLQQLADPATSNLLTKEAQER